MQDIMNLAVLNFKPTCGKKENNLQRMLGYAEAICKRGADMIVFPEMALMGYDYYVDESISYEDKKKNAEFFDGESAQAMAKISKKYGTYIMFGAPEVDKNTEDLYNSAFVVGPDGIIGAYRKIHPFATENIWCKKGEDPFLFDTPWGPVGIGICYDSYQFPELMRHYVYKGARLYINMTAELEEITHNGSRQSFKSYYRTLEYGVLCNYIYIASSNLVGYDKDNYFAGGSCILGPKLGPYYEVDVMYYAGSPDDDQETVSMATIDLSLAERRLCQINESAGEMDYRPEIYKKLLDM